jgi:hypothetical protein
MHFRWRAEDNTGNSIAIVTLSLLLSITFSGCNSPSPEMLQKANNLWENPQPLPTYIWNLYFGRGLYCVDTYLGFFVETHFAEPGISLADLVDLVQFELDGQEVSAEALGNDRYVFTACFNIQYVSTGLHFATIYLTSFSGEEVSYSWAFRVNGDLSSHNFEELATVVSVPPLILTPSLTNTPG